jgi:hypothetical protein
VDPAVSYDSNTLIEINNLAREIFHLSKNLPADLMNEIQKNAKAIFLATKIRM